MFVLDSLRLKKYNTLILVYTPLLIFKTFVTVLTYSKIFTVLTYSKIITVLTENIKLEVTKTQVKLQNGNVFTILFLVLNYLRLTTDFIM